MGLVARALFGADGRLRSGWRAALVLSATLLAAEGVELLVTVAAPARGAGGFSPLKAAVMLPVLLLVIWPIRRFLDRRSFRSLGFRLRHARKDILVGLALGCALVLAAAGGVLALNLVEWRSASLDPTLALRLALAAAGLAAAAMNEELIFRACLQGTLSEGIGRMPAILAASGIFALLHAGNPEVGLLALANVLAAGVLLGAFYQRFGSLWAPWALHFAWNLVQGTVLGVPVSGLRLPSLLEARPVGKSAIGAVLSGGDFGFEGGLLASAVLVAACAGVLAWKGRPPDEPQLCREEADCDSARPV